MVHFTERNAAGAWTVYGSDGVKQYYGYTKAEAIRKYNEASREIIAETEHRGTRPLKADEMKTEKGDPHQYDT